jgi:hypothetical protein
VEVDSEMSQAEYQRGFMDGLEYARSKVITPKNDLEKVLATLDDIIGRLKEERFQNFDEALMLLE